MSKTVEKENVKKQKRIEKEKLNDEIEWPPDLASSDR
jgi:hypothetical protein